MRKTDSVNELNQNHDNRDSLMSFPRNSEHENSNVNTVPKQVLDVVNLANSGMNSGKNL